MLEEELILVDEMDGQIGFMPKLEVHQKGLLHRAFSILVFNSKGQLLIQKRASKKYHSANLWTNTCCSHPKKGETVDKAVQRRLKEEMGIECDLKFAYKFVYKTQFENNLIEHEFDYVYLGEFDGNPILNLDEASEYKWIYLSDLRNDMQQNPEKFTYWFNIILKQHLKSFHFEK